VVLAAAAVIAVVVLWGGYGHHWQWTGINGTTATLWDWLHLLLLPIAFGLLPVLLSRRIRMRRPQKMVCIAAIAGLALVVVAGYAVPWSWTGFEGNKVWDWLELLALPLAVALTPLIPDLRRHWNRRHTEAALAGLAVFVVIVVGGYVGNWSWTGFRGNTLWDWLHLLLLPLLLPTVIVPGLVPILAPRTAGAEETQSRPASHAPAATPAPPEGASPTLPSR
jgi:hypothetical protein